MEYRSSHPLDLLPTICLMVCLLSQNHPVLHSRSYLELVITKACNLSTRLTLVLLAQEMLGQSWKLAPNAIAAEDRHAKLP
jgi:hypothetical protein